MKQNFTLRLLRLSFFALLLLITPARISAQCYNWGASATLTAASFCAANGTFTVSLSGPDVANLTNIQYGIPIAPNGFSVPLNSSPNFTGIPPGTYQVSVVAACGGSPVGRNTTITVPGSYIAPSFTIYPPVDARSYPSYYPSSKASLSCAPTGRIYAAATSGAYPFTYTLTAYPAAYTGPTTNATGIFDSLPPGVYTIQMVDACLGGTIPQNYTIASLNPATAFYQPGAISPAGCDSVILKAPFINSATWLSYTRDTGFKASIKINGKSSASPFITMPDSSIVIKLPTGKTIKDLYGDTITYTIQPPCGPSVTMTQILQAPRVAAGIIRNCNTDFAAQLGFTGGIACMPATYTLRNTATNVSYGPYTPLSYPFSTPPLPFGNYSLSLITGDGYRDTSAITVNPPPLNPYSVSVISGAAGLNNYAGGFLFTTTTSTTGGTKTVELFSGPSGYSHKGSWYNTQAYPVYNNQSPTPSTIKFPPGNYVWKITDACGVYYLSVTVSARDLYQFTVGPPAQQPACQGLSITPTGTSTNNGTGKNLGFSILLNGAPLRVGTTWPVYPLGTPILLTVPGIYTIVPTSSSSAENLSAYYSPGGFALGYPNIYTSSYTFTYTQQALAVDINQTQGFLCKGAGAGQGQIYAAGKNGFPFYSPPSPHYNYYLALPGNALSGPYLANNSTGIFTGFGGDADSFFDVKVLDTCGAFAVQRLKILDLGTARLISSSKYVACGTDSIQLSAIWLPNATYAWTGPNGFTSSLRQPAILNAGPLNAGVYRVTILTAQCNGAITDTTILVINQKPPKPNISYTCLPRPVTVSVTNAVSPFIYKWDIGSANISVNGVYFSHNSSLQLSDAPWRKAVPVRGSYMAVAIDTVTGCNTRSDSLIFLGGPRDTLAASIYSPHLQLCTGDTTILIAQFTGAYLNQTYQWFRNGLTIPGATGLSYTTNQPGNYRVFIDAGLCHADTSPTVTVTVVTRPVAIVTASTLTICSGDTAFLQAGYAAGYSYTWNHNGTVIPGAFSSTYGATQAGSYFVTISNGGCVAISTPDTITVIPSPPVALSPAGPQDICPGGSVHFSVTANPLYTYTWEWNGSVIPGAIADTFNAAQPGTYQVIVATAQCPHTPSQTVTVTRLPSSVFIGNDTTICADTAYPLPLSISDGFTQILWSTGETTQQINAPGSGRYWVRAQNTCGLFTDTMRIYSKADYDPGLPDDTLVCSSTGITRLSVFPDLQGIHWSTGATTSSIIIDTPGTYWMEALTPCGTVRDTVRVHFCKPEIQFIELSAVYNQPTGYQWAFAGGEPASSVLASPGTVCYQKAGVHAVILIVQNRGGADTVQSTIVVSARPVPRFKDTVVLARYKSLITLPTCAAAQTVDWYRGDTLVCGGCPELSIDARFFQSTYRCVVRNGDCPDTCTYSLRVIDIPQDIWLPDAFTPNGDGLNDIFRIITDNPNVQVINLAVHNRWGQHVFSSNRSNEGWDGTLHGVPAAGGIFFWHLSYRILGGAEIFQRKGDVTLIR